MKRISVLSVCLVGLLRAGLSLGADCAALPSDSIVQVECEYVKKRLAAPRALPARVIALPDSPQAGAPAHGQRRMQCRSESPVPSHRLRSSSRVEARFSWIRRG